jgi:ATP-binding cassette, subfamily C, bacterial
MAILTIRALGSLLPMQRQWQRFVQNRRNLNALTGLLDACASNREAPFGNVRPSLDKAIRLEGIGFAFGKRTLLSGLEIEVPAGQITTLVGRSGIGKSTIVDLVVGLQQPSVGRVTVDDVDLATIDLAAWRRAIGYVPQEVVLLHDSLRRNVVFGTPDTSPAAVAAAMEAAGASGFLADLPDGLDSSVGERGALLSGGQRQCIAIARALLLNPRLLILDEATTGLDPSTEAEICTRIRDLCRSRGLTVLAISHQPGWRRVADRVYRIEPGGTAALTSDPREAVA